MPNSSSLEVSFFNRGWFYTEFTTREFQFIAFYTPHEQSNILFFSLKMVSGKEFDVLFAEK